LSVGVANGLAETTGPIPEKLTAALDLTVSARVAEGLARKLLSPV
jgi:hypothetical protein